MFVEVRRRISQFFIANFEGCLFMFFFINDLPFLKLSTACKYISENYSKCKSINVKRHCLNKANTPISAQLQLSAPLRITPPPHALYGQKN